MTMTRKYSNMTNLLLEKHSSPKSRESKLELQISQKLNNNISVFNVELNKRRNTDLIKY
jgi:hypothetical protein